MIMMMISTTRRARMRVPLILSLITVFAACGDNLFQPPGSGGASKPEITGFTIEPVTLNEGGELDMQITGEGLVALSQITIGFTGALTRDTVIPIGDNARTVDREVIFTVPFNTGPGSNLDMTVTLIDAAGETATLDTTVTVLDATAPAIASWEATPGVVAVGEEISIDVEASDNRGLASVGVRVVSPTGYDTTLTETLDPGTMTHSGTFVLLAPDLLITTLDVTVFATDAAGLEQTGGDPATLSLTDRDGPVLAEIRVNDSNVSGSPTIPLGDSVKVEVDVSDPHGITSVTFKGLALVGDSVFFEEELVVRYDESSVTFPRALEDTLPKTLTVRRRLGSADDTTRGPVRFVVTAVDSLGNESEGTFDATVGGPSVVITDPSTGTSQAALADPVEVSVRFFDPAGIDSARLEVTGIIDSTIALVLPAITTDTFTITQPIATPITAGTFTVVATAWNTGEIIGQSDARTFVLGDDQGPDITNLLVQGSASASTVPLGDSVLIEADVADPSGISKVTMRGLAIVGDTVFFEDSVVTRFNTEVIAFPRPFQDTLPSDTTVRRKLGSEDKSTTGPVRLFVVAEDGLGNTSEATFDIYVGGPAVRITFPPEGDAYGVPVNDSIEIRMTFYDPTGVDSARLDLTGAIESNVQLTLPSNRTDTMFINHMVNLPATEGTIIMVARAWNTSEIEGSSGERQLDVLVNPPADTLRPVVAIQASPLFNGVTPPRLEFTDSFSVTVTARDQGIAGLKRIGFTGSVIRNGAVVYTLERDTTYAVRSGNEETLTFDVALDSIYRLLALTTPAQLDSISPDTVRWEIHGFAVDTTGAVACGVKPSEETRSCSEVADTSTAFFTSDTTGLQTRFVATRGKTIFLENTEATIADLALDTVADRLFLSNITQNLVEYLALDADPRAITFQDPVQVGSKPWGMFIGERVLSSADIGFTGGAGAVGDTVRALIVANSGGTNLSLVNLDGTAVEEVDSVRLFTPNSVLWSYQISEDDNGATTYSGQVLTDFSDRPQFLAQDSLYRIVYSTVSTPSATQNTIRFIVQDPDKTSDQDAPEMRFFLNDEMVDSESRTSLVLGNIDFARIRAYEDISDSVAICTHEPGYADRLICNDVLGSNAVSVATYVPTFEEATVLVQNVLDSIFDVRGNNDGIIDADEQAIARVYYPFFRRGNWDMGDIDMADITFVVASGNRGKIAIGEGFEAPTGRVFIWEASTMSLSNWGDYIDLVNNASERVLGLGLNWDGSLGVARGEINTFFFTPDLRLQGLVDNASSGGAGAVFHPDHDNPYDGGHHDVAAGDYSGSSFTGTPDHSVEVFNTFHFDKITELFIRDIVVGPLKAGPPLASDNAGFGRTCPNATITNVDDCVAMKLYGVTDTGGVVVMNVRVRDLKQ